MTTSAFAARENLFVVTVIHEISVDRDARAFVEAHGLAAQIVEIVVGEGDVPAVPEPDAAIGAVIDLILFQRNAVAVLAFHAYGAAAEEAAAEDSGIGAAAQRDYTAGAFALLSGVPRGKAGESDVGAVFQGQHIGIPGHRFQGMGLVVLRAAPDGHIVHIADDQPRTVEDVLPVIVLAAFRM